MSGVIPALLLAPGAVAQPKDSPAGDSEAGKDAGGTRVVVARKAVNSAGRPVLPPAPTGDSPEAVSLPRTHHPWARFQVGAWRTLVTTTESFDPSGKFVGRSETTETETLIALGDQDYTIEKTTELHVGGKRLRGEPQRVTHSLLTDSLIELASTERLPPANLNLDSRVVACERWQLRLGSGAQRRLETLYYNRDVSPFVLRREAVAADGTDVATELQSTSSVVRVEVPVTLDDEIVPGHAVTIVSQTGLHRIERTEQRTDAVPGGLVSATATERDAAGHRVRWSTVTLADFGEAGEPPRDRPRWRLFRRRADAR